MTVQTWPKTRLRTIAPSMLLTLMALANLAVLWFAVYKILPLTLMTMALVIYFGFRPVGVVSLRRIAPAVFSLALVYIYIGVATTWSPNPNAALNEFIITLLAITPALIFGYFIGSRFNVMEIAFGFGIMLLVYLVQVVFNKMSGGDAMLIGDFSIRSLLGGITCFTTPFLVATFLQRPRFFIGVQSLLSLLLVLIIESRSSVLIVIPVTLYVLFRFNRRAFKAALLLGAAGILAMSAVNIGQITSRFSPESTSLDISDVVLEEAAKPVEDRVDFDRRLAAFVSTGLFMKSPLFGAGYSSVLQTNEEEYGINIVSHGYIPGTLGELGLIGLTFVIFFFYQLYRLSRRSKLTINTSTMLFCSTGFWLGLAASVLYGFFHQTFESAFFVAIVGIAFGIMATSGRIIVPFGKARIV